MNLEKISEQLNTVIEKLQKEKAPLSVKDFSVENEKEIALLSGMARKFKSAFFKHQPDEKYLYSMEMKLLKEFKKKYHQRENRGAEEEGGLHAASFFGRWFVPAMAFASLVLIFFVGMYSMINKSEQTILTKLLPSQDISVSPSEEEKEKREKYWSQRVADFELELEENDEILLAFESDMEELDLVDSYDFRELDNDLNLFTEEN